MTFKCAVCGGLFGRADDPPPGHDKPLRQTMDVLLIDTCSACESEPQAPRGTLGHAMQEWDAKGRAKS